MMQATSQPRGHERDVVDTVRRSCKESVGFAQAVLDDCLGVARALVAGNEAGRESHTRHQAALHGCAWMGAYVQALREMNGWADRLSAQGGLGRRELLMLQAAHGEYLAQLRGGLPMSQGEVFRPQTLLSFTEHGAAIASLSERLAAFDRSADVQSLITHGFAPSVRADLAAFLERGLDTREFGDPAYDDDTLSSIRDVFSRYADDHAAVAHRWHLEDALIPDEVIAELARLGTFGLTIESEYGGAGMSKMAMCIVTEELSRGFVGLGSLGTRSEIAAELIGKNGTLGQKRHWLPAIADGSVLPAAAFTEPDVGSDLASVTTRAERTEGGYRIFGNKTWTTHGSRSDMLTLLVRTDREQRGHAGLSILLAPKPRGTPANAFPADGLRGTEIKVLGYRGMKEYEIAFDGFHVDRDALLGGVEGQGFRHLMATFESARIQTGARAVGVAQCALELGLAYARTRHQFARPILQFPRVADKLAWMGVETMVARQLCFFAARKKDAGTRCDLEAGMAKLLAARVAWANADNALQIHGGNGYAEEFPISRVLCDARILSVFEGAAEIQAGVIARAML